MNREPTDSEPTKSSGVAEPLSAVGVTYCRRRPLMGIALVFMAGTAFGLWLTPPVMPLLVVSGLLLIAAIIGNIRRRRWSGAAMLLMLALIGCAAAALRTTWPSPRAAAVRQLEPTGETVFRIQITGDPVSYTTHSGRLAWDMPADILAWYDTDAAIWRKGSGTLTIRWRAGGFRPAPRYGDRWQVSGNYYSADWRPVSSGYQRFWAQRTERISGDHGYGWIAQCFRWRRMAAARLAAGIKHFPERVAVVHALLLGLRQELNPSLRDLFATTGTLHVMAISGLHVGVMTGLFVFVLKSAGASRAVWFYFLAPLLIAYTIATGARPSAVRACIMALAYWSALPLRRRPDAPSALALAALIILVYDPRQLITPGFLFSFIVVAGLLVFFHPLYFWMTRPLRLWNLYKLPVSPSIYHRELEKLAYGIAGLVTVSIIAWFMAAPLSALFFGNLSLISLAANLLVVPLVLMIVVTGCLALVAGTLFPALGTIFNYANLVWTGALLRVLPWFAGLPGASIAFSFPAWVLPLWYGPLAWLGWRIRTLTQPDHGTRI